jgi:hypothetical protein
MYLLSIDPVRDGYAPEKSQVLFEKLTERLKASGPVRSIALAADEPFLAKDDDEGSPLIVEDPGKTSPLQQ